jgi:hypothetical protein
VIARLTILGTIDIRRCGGKVMAEAQTPKQARSKTAPRWLFLSPTVPHPAMKKSEFSVDTTSETGFRDNPEAFPYTINPNGYNGLRYPREVTGGSYNKVKPSDYVSHIKQRSTVGGRGSSDAEYGWGEMIAEIAASDFPFIRLVDEPVQSNIDFSLAKFAEPFPFPEGREKQSWDPEQLTGIYYRYSYRNRLNVSAIGTIVEGYPCTCGCKKLFASRQGRYNHLKKQA